MPYLQNTLKPTGASVPNFFISTSSCCPSRTTILRGQYSRNTGVRRNQASDGGWETFHASGMEDSTIAGWLSNAGYATGLFGKYLNGYGGVNNSSLGYVPPGWSRWFATHDSTYYNYKVNDDGAVTSAGGSEAEYQPSVIAAAVDAWVEQNLIDGVPFFAFVSPNSPHSTDGGEPPLWLSKYDAVFDSETAPRNPNFNEADVSTKPHYVSHQGLLTLAQIDGIDALRRARLRSLQSVDEMIKTLVKTLSRHDKLNDTYFIVTSDNGHLLGEHRIPSSGKTLAYQEVSRTTAFVRGPGIPHGSVMSDLVGNVDLAPTIARMAGIADPSIVDGRSFLGALKQNATISRKAFPSEAWKENTLPSDFWLAGYRTATYKYIEYNTDEREFYDLVADPYELNNLASILDTNTLNTYSAYVSQLKVSSGQSCRQLENNPPE